MNHSFYLVAGLGKTGLSIARYLSRKKHPFAVFDTRSQPSGLNEFYAEFPDVTVYLETLPDAVIPDITDIIASPGLSLDLPFFQKARERGIAIYGDIECLVRAIKAPIIAITGTNGKSTVTTLVGEMAKAAGINVAVAGNIGTPVLDLLNEQEYELWVLELSSFQLDLTHSLKATAATILNVSPDHLDRHHTLDAYILAKQRVYHESQTVVYNRDELATTPITVSHTKTVTFGNDAPRTDNDWGLISHAGHYYLAKGKNAVLAVDSLLIKGVHNWHNALAACALADAVAISHEVMIAVLTSFKGLPHRCQWVRKVDSVDWINDSKGTNIGATVSAIKGIGGSVQGKIVLIAGGQGKGADFSDLKDSVSAFVRSVILIGEDAIKIAEALNDCVPMTHATDLDKAVIIAKEQAQAGDVVLLSPACASLDMFRDYTHRGEVFSASVMGL